MRVIFYDNRPAAIANDGRVVFCTQIDVLEVEHPVRRFVSAICIWSLDVDAGRLPIRWDQLLLEVYARALLMPTELFDPLERELPDHELAEHFGVPLEQVELRREDLAALEAAGG
ncbi:MAG: ImmA/IrrE family metallo-endopeptidase [Actinomycetota bacterium]|nr:ImmA/IrrE family metallo-endopeptidase [Actinomycetota bacterium]